MKTPEPARRHTNGGGGHASAAPENSAASSAPTAIEITRIRNSQGVVTKRIKLDADGKLAVTPAAQLFAGTMERLPLADWRQLADLLAATPNDTAYALGRLRADLPDSVPLVTKAKAGADPSKGVSRSRENFTYREGAPGLVLLDHDVKGMPLSVKDKIEELGGFPNALEYVCPGITAAGRVRRLSTSSGIYRTDTNEQFQKAGEHDFLLTLDAADAERTLNTLHDRAWVLQLGWHTITASGALAERSIVDRSVFAPERLCFEATPDLEPPLAQKRPAPEVLDGPAFDTRAKCLALTPDEERARQAALEASRKALESEAARVRAEWIEKHIGEAVKRGVSREAAERTVQNWVNGILLPDALLDFSTHGMNFISVRDVLADPARFEGLYIPDPIEGAAYSTSSALVRQSKDGGVIVLSFAHGLRTVYLLRHDFATVKTAIEAATPARAICVLRALLQHAEINAAEEAELVKLASGRFAADLLERAANDAGAPFEPEAVSSLAWLKGADAAAFQRLREGLKRLKIIRISDLDKLIEKETPEQKDQPKDERSQLDILLALAQEATLFHAPDGMGYADVQIDEQRETWALNSKGFADWLRWRFHQKTKRAPSSEAFQAALNMTEAHARFDAPERPIYVRVGGLNGKIYLDLCGADWRAVEIDANGWRIIDAPPVRFRRAAGMEPLPIPEPGGSVENLRPFLNVASEEDFVLTVAFLLMTLKDEGPYAILALLGEQGAAKSFFTTLLRRLIDPNFATLRTLPKDERDLAIGAKNAHIQAFDNVSSLPPWISDALCRLATGGGFGTRLLYANDEEALFDSCRPIILNGIDGFITRPDLGDRCVALELAEITDDKRKVASKLMDAFEREAPGILGALLDAVAHGLRHLPTLEIDRLPRMADFFLWVSACEGALWAQGTFAQAYEKNRAQLAQKNVEADHVAYTICEFINLPKLNGKWSGTTGDLLASLNMEASSEATQSKFWPSTPRGLSSRLKRVTPPLRKIGVNVVQALDGHTKANCVTITLSGECKGQPDGAFK